MKVIIHRKLSGVEYSTDKQCANSQQPSKHIVSNIVGLCARRRKSTLRNSHQRPNKDSVIRTPFFRSIPRRFSIELKRLFQDAGRLINLCDNFSCKLRTRKQVGLQ